MNTMRRGEKGLVFLFILIISVSIIAGTAQANIDIEVKLDQVSLWEVDPNLFGIFSEVNWGDVTPAIYEQYIVNPSFEKWKIKPGGNEKQPFIFDDNYEAVGVARPWYPIYFGDHEADEYNLSTNGPINSERAQHIKASYGVLAGVAQRIAFPDRRVKDYTLRFYARKSSGLAVVLVGLMDQTDTLAGIRTAVIVPVGTEWGMYKVPLTLGENLLPRRYNSHFGKGKIVIVGKAKRNKTGNLYIDQATLFPTDCVSYNGGPAVYNPTTYNYFKNIFKPTCIRWPGGNYASTYDWEKGIGPIDNRETTENIAWGGTVPNHVGTDEILQFCELVGLEPVLTVAYDPENPTDSAAKAAAWVEYCNAGSETTQGARRAANGHAEPYDVTYWNIGNETYYRIGELQGGQYGQAFVAIGEAMKSVDNSIQLIVEGFGLQNRIDDAINGRSSPWNKNVLDAIRVNAQDGLGLISILDAHYYMNGPETGDADTYGWDYVLRALMGGARRVGDYQGEFMQLLNTYNGEADHINLALLEWSVLPSVHVDEFHSMRRQTYAASLCTATLYNEMIRNGERIQMGALHNMSYCVQPQKAHSEPPNPRSTISAFYTSLAESRHIESVMTNCPVYTIDQDFEDIGQLPVGVPEVDCLALADKDDGLNIILINRNTNEEYSIDITLSGRPPLGESVNGFLMLYKQNDSYTDTIYEQYTWERFDADPKEMVHKISNSPIECPISLQINLNLPVHTLALIHFDQLVP